METVLAILLYLNAICTCTYQKAEIDNIIMIRDPEITQIQSDPELTNQIILDYGYQVDGIVIIDEISGG